ncbi:hypothetical protein [Actinomyces sp. HMSC035G02]|uniref:hypothetical protein n=1 Tax=Actinomyces sp. HMSC035G02 TaxID=1739406 RepID=UPI0008AA4EF1|nr:hypothetical protein [Actinomyces sp. HMSC035G02]MBS5722548.1 hypothetical protein [Actinomyces sp.]OHR18837.1 hypothetical protein HMPREF2902_01260 [Actinomyces sp. HMSC035G02]
MINAYETEDGVVFDMSGLECEALRSYADGLLADPAHPFVELLRSQGLVVGDTPVPHLAALLQAFSQATKVLTAWVVAPAGCRRSTFFVGPRSVAVLRCDDGLLLPGEDDPLSVWVVDSAQLRDTFFELSAIGEPSGEGIVPTAVPTTLFGALERAEVTEILVEVPKVAREIAEVIDVEVDEVTGTFWADVADDAWVGLAVRVVDAVEYPSLEGESWRLVATSEEVCEVLAGVEFTELYPDEVPLLADKDGEFWAVAAPSSPGVLWEDIEDVLSE